MAAPRNGTDIEQAKVCQEDLDRKPWKYIGYRGFAAFVASDDDFFALRRFDALHSRILLILQDNVCQLEEELSLMDTRLSARDADDVDNGSVRNDQAERRDILVKIHRKLEEYDTLLSGFLELKRQLPASNISTKNMQTWLINNNGPIHEKEIEFIRHTEDLISLAKRQKSSIRYLFERHVLVPTGGLFGLFTRKPALDTSPLNHKTVVQGEDAQLDTFSTVAIFLVATGMLVAPLWILAEINEIHRKLAVITAFLLVFLLVLCWGTVAKPFEILAATAGYSAVLVVFLQLAPSTTLQK